LEPGTATTQQKAWHSKIAWLFFIIFGLGVTAMGMLQEFKAFAMKGNVVDMAVGVVIGGAFGKIVSSLVSDIIMPVVGKLTGGMDFSSMRLEIQAAVPAADGTKAVDAVYINYGTFISTAIDFLIIAAAIFMAVKVMNSMKKKEEAAPKTTPEDIQLLREIRDNLATTR
jgi:large conductance mechanosensitive channel